MKQVRKRNVPGWLGAILILGTFGPLLWLENRRPLRRRVVESKLRRNVRNLAVAMVGAVSVQRAEQPVVRPLARLVEKRRLGLQTVELSPELERRLAKFIVTPTVARDSSFDR